jgi:hypothetical protein
MKLRASKLWSGTETETERERERERERGKEREDSVKTMV